MRLAYMFMALFLVGVVNAFTITSPEATTYNTNDILFNIVHNETLDSMNYSLDNSSSINLCTNCSGFNTTLNLTEGVHTILVTGTSGNDTLERQVEFNIDILPAFTLEIGNPKPKTYNTNIVDFDVESDMILERMYYVMDNSSGIDACTNCSEFNATLNLTDGTYNLTVYGILENVTKSDSVEFDVNVVESFDIVVKSPEAKTYRDGNISILVESNVTLDLIHVELDDLNWTCINCSRINNTIKLEHGDYTLKAKGYLDEWTKTVFVDFIVAEEPKNQTNVTKRNQTNESRFDTGFEKLPKMLAAGELTDKELVEIIRNNKLNPGVLNRLIKTGKLGNESINAILDTQFQPQGIFWKLLGKIGIKQKTYSSRIADTYNLTEETKEKILQREDLPKKTKEKITNEAGNSSKVPPGQAKKVSNTDVNDGNGKFPPGQAKKINTSEPKGNGKTPPGQAKKLV